MNERIMSLPGAEKILSIPSFTEDQRVTAPTITSYSIWNYLGQDRHLEVQNMDKALKIYPGRPEDFSSELHLPMLKTIAGEVRSNFEKKNYYRFHFDQPTELGEDASVGEKLYQQLQVQLVLEDATVVEGERMTNLFYNTQNQRFELGSIFYGEAADVTAHFRYPKEFYALLNIHTHPFLGFFSPQDFGFMLIKSPNGFRYMSGALVLCPDMQILALATNQTPTYSEEKAGEIISAYQKSMGVEDSVTTKVRGVYEYYASKFIQEINDIDQRTEGRIQYLVEGLQSEADELEFFEGDFSNEYPLEFQRFVSLIKEVGSIQSKIRKVETRRTSESRLQPARIGFARDMNIKLYSSTDMEHFKEFSA